MFGRVHQSKSLQLLATAGPVLIVGLAAFLTVRAVGDAAATRGEVDRSHRVMAASDHLLQRLVDAETAQRGFIVTAEEGFLEPLRGVETSVDSALAELGRLAQLPSQRRHVAELAPAAGAVLENVQRNVAIRRGRPAPRADVGVRLTRGKDLMDNVRRRVDELQGEQAALLQARSAREASRTRIAFAVLIAGGVASALAMVLANLFFARYTAEWKHAAGELEASNERLREHAVELEAANEQLRDQAAELEMQSADLQTQAVELEMVNEQLGEQAVELEMQAADLQTQAAELEESGEALRRSEHRFRSLIENASDLITVLGHDGTIEYLSPNVRRVLGYDPQVLLGTSAFTLVHLEDRGAFRRGLRESERRGAGQTMRIVECRCRHADGSWRLLEITTSVLPEHAEGRDLVLNSRDVTERRRAEADLHRTEELLRQAAKLEAVGRLAGGVAHDFNNLLTVIGGNAALLEDEVSPAGRELLDEVTGASRRAASLTRQLLMFSRRDGDVPSAAADVNQVIEGVLGMLRRLISEDIEIHLSLDPGLGAVRIDPGKLEQVMINLAVNASDAMPHGGHLTIETRAVVVPAETLKPATRDHAPLRAVLLAVSDTGAGMDEETQARVFEPFFTTKAVGKGTGLGLSTTYGIVQQSGGNVLVYSEPGVGTTFKIYLPEADAAPAAERTPVEAAEPAPRTGTILLVEDEPGVRKLMSTALSRGGYRVLVADGPAEAVRVSRAFDGPVHLMVTDVVMPGGTGTELARGLLAERAAMKVLYMSGYTREAISRHGITDTGSAFLHKPCTPSELLRTVDLLLREPSGAGAV